MVTSAPDVGLTADDELQADLVQVDVPAVGVAEEEAKCSRLLSVQSVVAALCFFGILVCGVTTMAVSDVSCDNALDDTRSNCDASTEACFDTAFDSLESTVYEMLGYVSFGVEGMVDGYLENTNNELRKLQVLVETTYPQRNKTQQWMFDDMAPFMWFQLHSLLRENTGAWGELRSPIRGIGIFADDIFYNLNAFDSGLWAFINHPDFPHLSDRPCWAAKAYDITGLPLSKENGTYGADYVPMLLTAEHAGGIDLSRAGFIADNQVKWSNVQILGNFLGYLLTRRIPDPAGSVKDLEISVMVTVMNFDNFLQSVAHKAEGLKDASDPRIFLTIASSWVAEARRARKEKNWQDYDQAGWLVGASSGDSTEVYTGREPLSGHEGRRLYRPVDDVNATDPIIRGIARSIHEQGGYERIAQDGKRGFATLTINKDVDGGASSVREAHLVSIGRMVRPEGLDWWVVLSLSRDSVLKDVQESYNATYANIEKSKEDVEDQVDAERTQTKLIVAGVAVALVLLSFYVSYRVVAPIKRVQEAMSRVATMELEGSEQTKISSLYEVRRMQHDFTKMVDCLKEYRAYVPSSLLQSVGKKDVAMEPPTGNVAILFTDIQGSTALWKRSAMGMNEALEIHNEAIRECYFRHDGYEVKTIGDSFMISFANPTDALGCALDIQIDFAKRRWPSTLDLPPAGLVIRIGINCGPAITESNPVTGRVDYRGSTVNMAARVESKARGGTVCITSDLLAAVKRDLPSVGTPVVTPHGAHELKGLGTGHQLYSVVPQGFDHRLNDSETDCIERDDAVSRTHSVPLDRMSAGSSEFHTPRSEGSGMVPNAKVQNKTQLQLVRGSVTVAVCRLLDMDESKLFNACNVMIRAVSDAAVASDGVVGSVTGRTMTIVWNASKRCKMHRNAALTCTAQLEKRTSSVMRIGVATGMMLHGNVGTQKSRFSTTFGLALEVAEAVADHSIAMGCFSLYADCSTERFGVEDASLQGSVRLIDAWMDEREKRVLRIFQVMSETVLSQAESWGGGLAEDDMSQQNEAQSTLVSEILTADGSTYVPKVERLRMLANEKADAVLQNVVTIFSDIPAPTKGYRCTVSFTRVPKQAAFR